MKASISGARLVNSTTFSRSSAEASLWGSWSEASSSAGDWADSGRREKILLASFFGFLGEEGLGSLASSRLLAVRFLEDFFAAFRTCFEILGSVKIPWSSSGLALDMLSMLDRLAFWRAWTFERAVANGTLASWVRKRRRVGRSVGVLILDVG
jgi:hypothetical protein